MFQPTMAQIEKQADTTAVNAKTDLEVLKQRAVQLKRTALDLSETGAGIDFYLTQGGEGVGR